MYNRHASIQHKMANTHNLQLMHQICATHLEKLNSFSALDVPSAKKTQFITQSVQLSVARQLVKILSTVCSQVKSLKVNFL